MILSGKEIASRIGRDIIIDPYDANAHQPQQLQPGAARSVTRLQDVAAGHEGENECERLTIPAEGLVLEPNRLYLGRTVEYTETHNLVPMLEGRSSIGRLGPLHPRDRRLRRRRLQGLLDIGDLLRSSRSASTPVWRSARSTITPSRASTTNIRVGNIKTITASSRVCCTKTSSSNPLPPTLRGMLDLDGARQRAANVGWSGTPTSQTIFRQGRVLSRKCRGLPDAETPRTGSTHSLCCLSTRHFFASLAASDLSVWQFVVTKRCDAIQPNLGVSPQDAVFYL
jgi:hypothetical protein